MLKKKGKINKLREEQKLTKRSKNLIQNQLYIAQKEEKKKKKNNPINYILYIYTNEFVYECQPNGHLQVETFLYADLFFLKY